MKRDAAALRRPPSDRPSSDGPGAAAVPAGRKVRAALERALGLGGGGDAAGWRVARAESIGHDRLRVRLEDGARALAFELASTRSPEPFQRLPRMAVVVEGPRPDDGEARLLGLLARRLERWSSQELVALVDPRAAAAGERPSGAAGEKDPLDGGVRYLRRDAASWRTFLVPDMVNPHTDGICESRSMVFIRHEDPECRRIARLGDPFTFLYNQRHSYHRRVSNCGVSDFSGARILSTDLREGDVVHGPNAKLEAALRSPAAAGPPRPTLTVVSGSCLEEVVGDDAALAVRRAAPDRAVLRVPAEQSGVDGVLPRLLAAGTAPRRRGRAAGHAADFFGYPRTPGFGELAAFLRELGIGLNASLWPSFDDEAVASFGRARVLIGMRGAPVPWWLRLDGLGHEVRRSLPAPFGVARTRAWLMAVAAEFGKEGACASLWRRRSAAWRPGLDELRRECGRHAVAFVLDEIHGPGLLSDDGLDGFSPLALVLELGFRVVLFEYRGGGAGPVLPAPAPGGARVRRRPFASRAELRRLLRREPVDAIYSDIGQDTRVLAAGKAQFSSRDADMGAGGALRYGASVLAACRASFFSRYRGWLQAGRAA